MVPKFSVYKLSSQYMVDPTPFALSITSLSLPSFTTKCKISLNLLESSALHTTSNSNRYPGSKNACFILGLNIDIFCLVNA